MNPMSDSNAHNDALQSPARPWSLALSTARGAALTGLAWGMVFGFFDALPALLEGDPTQDLGRRLLAWLFLAIWNGLFFGLVLTIASLLGGVLRSLPWLRGGAPSGSGFALGFCAALTVAGYGLHRFPDGSPGMIALLALLAGAGLGWLGWLLARRGAAPRRAGRWVLILAAAGLSVLVVVAIVRHTVRDWRFLNPPVTGQTATSEHPNIILISIDALRADRLGAHGYQPSPSPRIDELASQGITFWRGISQGSATPQSVSSFQTSLYPTELGFFSDLPWVVDSERVTIAEALQAGGYRTQGYVANGHLGVAGGFAQGFDGYVAPEPNRPYGFDRLRDETVMAGLAHRYAPALNRLFEHAYGLLFDPLLIMENGGERINTLALRFIRLHGDEQFFLWLHYMEPHAAYAPSQLFGDVSGLDYPEIERTMRSWKPSVKSEKVVIGPTEQAMLRALYDGEIQDADRLVGEVWDQIVAQGLADRTLLVITSDHGDEFADHGDYGHGQSVYQELLNVPLIFVGPQVAQPGRTVDTPVPLLDLLPTFVDIAGAPMPDLVRGQSLLPVLAGADPAERRFVGQNRANRTRYEQDALFLGYIKVIYSPLRDRIELYDILTDPGEQNDLSGTDPERAAALSGELKAWESSALETWAALPKAGVAAAQVDEAMQEALKRIGY